MHIKDACKKFNLTEAQLSCLRSGLFAERSSRQTGEVFTFGVRVDTLVILRDRGLIAMTERYRDETREKLKAQMEEHIQDGFAAVAQGPESPHETIGRNIERWQFAYVSLQSARDVERKLRETCYTITATGAAIANTATEG